MGFFQQCDGGWMTQVLFCTWHTVPNNALKQVLYIYYFAHFSSAGSIKCYSMAPAVECSLS